MGLIQLYGITSNDVEWSFDNKKVKYSGKVSLHVSLGGLRKQTRVDTFRKCIEPPLNPLLHGYSF